MSVPWWTSVYSGQEILPLEKHISLDELKKWADVSGDYNPIHYDMDFAASRGLSRVVVHGQLITALLCQMLANWFGAAGCLKKLDVKYKELSYMGDTIMCRGLIKKISLDENLVALEIYAENQRNKRTATGSAVIQFLSSGYTGDISE